MPARALADTGKVAPLRLILLAAICVLCLCAYAPVSQAPGALLTHAGVHHKSSHRHALAHRVRCARRSSFHTSGGKPRHAKRHASCHKKPSRRRHTRSKRHGHSHRSPAAAHSSSCPDADLQPSQENLARIRTATLCLVNRERAGNGESALSPNERLEQVAQAHTEDMAFNGYFEHVGRRGDTPVSRMRADGYIYSSNVGYEVGENIGWGTLWLSSPRAIVSAWMNSPEHRANILNGHYRDTAIGVSPHLPSSLSRQHGAIYTQDFGVIITG